ncbi:MAG: DUF4242 domain-containing protein [Chloroflexi bacterium]|nr:DUF4242 domain-containing protein [Chloroflexota bacterium]
MARFLDIHTIPSSLVREDLVMASRSVKEAAPDVKVLQTCYNLEEGRAWCLTEADNPTAVERAHLQVNMPFESIRRIEVIEG